MDENIVTASIKALLSGVNRQQFAVQVSADKRAA
jgi:hypothetical protein